MTSTTTSSTKRESEEEKKNSQRQANSNDVADELVFHINIRLSHITTHGPIVSRSSRPSSVKSNMQIAGMKRRETSFIRISKPRKVSGRFVGLSFHDLYKFVALF